MIPPRFWMRLTEELNHLLSGAKTPPDFVSRFYLLVEEVPVDTDDALRTAFEEFHYQVANYEADSGRRMREPGLIGEIELKQHAREFLEAIRRNWGYET